MDFLLVSITLSFMVSNVLWPLILGVLRPNAQESDIYENHPKPVMFGFI